MSFQFNGSQANVTISGAISTAPFTFTAGKTQTLINNAYTGTGAAQNTYTVPAGYKFHLLGVSFDNNADGHFYIYKTDGASQVAGFRLWAATSSITNIVTNICPIWTYAAAEIVKVNTPNGAVLNIIGILESV